MLQNKSHHPNDDARSASEHEPTTDQPEDSIPKGLSPKHFRQLHIESGISPEIIKAAGFRTIYGENELVQLGFSRAQAKTAPGLLVREYGVDGLEISPEFRSDDPPDPKRKYVSPPRTRNRLAISLLSLKYLPNPSVPILVTEGFKKLCAVISHMREAAPIFPISVRGVYGWRGSNEFGGKSAIPDFESIPLNGRLVYLCFDSDAMTKKDVYTALSRFKAFLVSKGAKVKVVYLPDGEDGSKTGADDYLASGYTLEEILFLSSDKLKSIDNGEQDTNPKDSVVETVLAERYRGTIVYASEKEPFQYEAKEPGVWSPVREVAIKLRVRNDLDEFYPRGFDSSKLSGVMTLLRVALTEEMPALPMHLIPYNNGVLDTTDMSFHRHEASRFCTWTLGYDHNPNAECQRVENWANEAMGGDAGMVKVLRAFANAVIKRRVDLQVFLELIGPGGTGKGTFMRLLMALIGYDNVKPTELLHLETNRFELSQLVGKRLILITDEDRYGGGVSNLKKITGQDLLRGEFKNVSEHIDFVAEGLVVLAANEAVQSSDYTSGLARRRITVPFKVRPKEPQKLIEFAAKKPVGLFAEHLPGVTNWALKMEDAEVERILRNATATSAAMHDAKMENLVATNPLASWANYFIVHKSDEDTRANVGVKVRSKDSSEYEHVNDWLYPNYVRYMEQTGHKAVSMNRFSDLLIDLLQSQLMLPGVAKDKTRDGVQITAVRIRQDTDKDDLLVTPIETRTYQ